MSALKGKSNRNTIRADGVKIRELRLQLGLTQMELAAQIDCSERLIRKMEKGEVVDAKSVAMAFEFFIDEGFKLELPQLFLPDSDAASARNRHFAEAWFKARFLDRSLVADDQWLGASVKSCPIQLALLRDLEQREIKDILNSAFTDDSVAIRFLARHEPGLSPAAHGDSVATLWLTVDASQIKKIQI